MLLPNYKEIIRSDLKETTRRIIQFDKVWVHIFGDIKYKKVEMVFHINQGYRRRNVNLGEYILAINDYFISHPCWKVYNETTRNIFDLNYVRTVEFNGLKINGNEFRLMKEQYPNLSAVYTKNCTIYKEASIGSLNCYYTDYHSDIMSLDSLNGFSGKKMYLKQTHFRNENQKTLNLDCTILELCNVDIDYEKFFLTTDAPKLRKLEINRTRHKKMLSHKDLLFISGFYNLEFIEINGTIENYDQIRKLERLREIRRLFQTDESKLEKTKQARKQIYEKIRMQDTNEERLQNYLMYQTMAIQNQYLKFANKLYVPRLERVKWENKITTKKLSQIRDELIAISNMSSKERKNISREKREFTLFDDINGLWFDKVPSKDDDEYILVDTYPTIAFADDFMELEKKAIKYYVKNKKIIVDE